MATKKIMLVTGSGGAIGSMLAKKLVSMGHNVYGTLWNGDSKEKPVPGATSVRLDIGRADDLKKLQKIPFHTIFHLAARAVVPLSVKDPKGDFQSNTQGTFNMLEFARRIKAKRFVFTSSVSTLDPRNKQPLTEKSYSGPSSPYAAAKLAGEGYCTAYFKSYGLSTTIARLTNAYGPIFKRFAIWDIINKILDNPKEIGLLGKGEQTRDFIYIDDAVQALIKIAEKGQAGEKYNISSGKPVKIINLARMITKTMGYPNTKIVSSGPSWPGDVKKWYANNFELRKLGYSRKVSLMEGLKRTVKHVRSLR